MWQLDNEERLCSRALQTQVIILTRAKPAGRNARPGDFFQPHTSCFPRSGAFSLPLEWEESRRQGRLLGHLGLCPDAAGWTQDTCRSWVYFYFTLINLIFVVLGTEPETSY